MKKIIMTLVCVVLLAACVVIPASAADHTVSVNTTPAFRGEIVTFTATIGTDVKVSGGSVDVNYDAAVLEYVSAAWNLPGTTMLAEYMPSNSVGVFAYGTGVSETISGTIFTIKFKVKDAAAFGESAIALNVSLSDENKKDITVINSPGAVKVECHHDFTQQDIDSKYLASGASCTASAKYYYSCTLCGEKGTATFEYGDPTSHNFTREDPQTKYLMTPASCTAKAVYYKSCVDCGAKGTTTFEYGTFADHVYDKEKVDDQYKVSGADCENPAIYNKSCVCGLKGTLTFNYGVSLGHTGGTATCTQQAVCTRCHQTYGSLKSHVYTQEKAEDKYLVHEADCQNAATYKKSCECGAAGDAIFTVGSTTEHVYDKKNTNEIYLQKKATCTENAVYYYSCKCGAKGTTTFEDTGASGHSYLTVWSNDKNGHWHECSKCGDKKDESAHIAGPAATEKDPQICTECLYIIVPALGHTQHDFSDEWTGNMYGHWHACSGCSEQKDMTPHTFDNPCDAVCADCGYERGVLHTYDIQWKTDDGKHWNECKDCGLKVNEGEHIAGPEATEYTAQKCTVCGYVLAPALDHEHKGGDVLSSDESGHWTQCECGHQENKTEHTWDEGVVLVEPTTKENGEKLLTCTACGYSKTVVMEKLEIPERTTAAITTRFEVPNGGDQSDENGCNGCGGIIGIGAIVFILIAVTVVVIITRRKSTV